MKKISIITRAAMAAKFRLDEGADDAWWFAMQFEDTRWTCPQTSAELAEAVRRHEWPEESAHCVYWAVKNAVQASFDASARGGHSRYGCKIAHIYARLYMAGKTDAASLRRVEALLNATNLKKRRTKMVLLEEDMKKIKELQASFVEACDNGSEKEVVIGLADEIARLQRDEIENVANAVLKDGIDAATFASVAVTNEVCPGDEAYEISGSYTAAGLPVVVWFE